MITLLFLFAAASAQMKYPSILWEIKKNPSSKPSYLFGTYHSSSKGVFKLGDSIFYALRRVDMVATEVNDLTWQKNRAMMDSLDNAYGIYNNYLTGQLINEGTLRKTNTIQKLSNFMAFQPSAINYFLYRNTSAGEGFEEEAYLDMFLSSAGFKLGKKIGGLENTMTSEIRSIEGQKDEAMEEKKENMQLPDGLSADDITDLIFDGYKNNSLDMMDSLDKYNYSSPAFYKKFIVARNYDQADSLDYYIRQGYSVFAAVGSAHLPGDEGVIRILQKKGYRLRPVKLKGHAKDQIESIKKMIIPVRLLPQQVDGGITCMAPGPLYHHFSNVLLRCYSAVDMGNGGYYMLSRLYNNSYYFGKTDTDVVNAMDSLLYESIKGDIQSKKRITYKGLPGLEVVSRLKNKDYERYRFIVTPYEILTIKAGGRNQYVNMPVVDSFFNSFAFDFEKAPDPASGIRLNTNTDKWHTWNAEVFGEALQKVRLTNFDRKGNTMNGVIKLFIDKGDVQPDQQYYKLAAESFTSSFALKKEENQRLDFSKNFSEQAVSYNMESGGKIVAKTMLRHPYLYVFYSASQQGKPDTSWFAGVNFISEAPSSLYPFTDSLKGISVKLAYPLSFNERWKSAKEKKVEKPDPNKERNRTDALQYNSKNIYNDMPWDWYTFQHPRSMEVIRARTCSIDSNFYYPDAFSFWKAFIPVPYKENTADGDNLSYGYNPFRLSRSYGAGRGTEASSLPKPSSYIVKLVYDTASATHQRVSFVVADSQSTKGVYVTYILHNRKVYSFKSVVSAPGYETQPFFNSFMSSFKPFNNDTYFNIYENRLSQLVAAYTNASPDGQPDIAERLNTYHFGIKDLHSIDSAMIALKEQVPANNILRKKLVAAVCDQPDDDANWPVISRWLKKVYHDNNELLTIRMFALGQILDAHKMSDLEWVLENMNSNEDFKGSQIKSALISYFSRIPDKDIARKRVRLKDFESFGGKGADFSGLALLDSGYYALPEIKAAFADIKKLLANEKNSLQLEAEKESFRYPEKAEKKELSSSLPDNNFRFITGMFSGFYGSLPEDSFFVDGYQKIKTMGSASDRLDLLDALLKQKTLQKTWISVMLDSLEKEKTLYLDIYKAFLRNKHTELLPEVFRNRNMLARSVIKAGYSNKLDTLYFYGSSASPYTKTDTVYFFKYREQENKNEQIVYVTLPADLSVLLRADKALFKFTDEQVRPGESFATISQKLMRKNYINSLYFSSEAEYADSFYLDQKDEKSLDIDE